MKKLYSEKELEAFLNYTTLTKISEKAGISYKRARELKNDPEFMAMVNKTRTEAFIEAARFMQKHFERCVYDLLSIIGNPMESAQVRINACNTYMTHCTRLTKEIDVIERLQELEIWKEKVTKRANNKGVQ